MQIQDAAAQYNSNVISNAHAAVKNQGVERTVSNVNNLQPGHIFEGTVNSVKNGVVSIGLSTGDTLSARLDSGVTLNQGESVFFQVKSASDNTIQIRALTGQNSFNPTLEKALNAASLPINSDNLNLVNTMMQEKMSIDAASLNAMAKLLAKNPMVNASTLVQMHKLGIDMTPENISQFENYKADEGAILKELDQVMDSLPKALSSSELSLDNAVGLGREIISVLTEGLTEGLAGEAAGVISEGGEAAALLDAETAIANGDTSSLGAAAGSAEDMILAAAEQALFDDDAAAVGGSAQEATEGAIAGETVQQGAAGVQGEAEAAVWPDTSRAGFESPLERLEQMYKNTDIRPGSLAASMEPKTLLEFSDTLRSMDFAKDKLSGFFDEQGVLRPEKSGAELMKNISDALVQADEGDVTKLFNSEGFQKSIKSLMEQQWLLKPDQVSEGKDTIKELYARLENQMQQLENAMARAGIPHENFTAAAQDVSNNIDFMNQLNQAYTYIQLPLKMSGQNANGDLYVYTNKKALKDPDAEVSAFLHFDMDNLGTTDVSVKMLHKNVTTHFYLETEEAMDFIANNLHLLDNRLKAKGYTCNSSASNEEKKQDFVHDFLMKDEKNVGTVHRYSFDVRA